MRDAKFRFPFKCNKCNCVRFRHITWDTESEKFQWEPLASAFEHTCTHSKWVFESFGEPEQFTGLKDKNGNRDLYAGDRVVIGNDRGVLVWDEYDLCWSLQLPGDVGEVDGEINAICSFYADEERDNIEYLGSIHENPELLK